jgi:hypothetical protein
MAISSPLALEYFLRDYTLATSICVELYSTTRNDSNEIWAQTFERRTPAFDKVYREEDLECFTEVEDGSGGQRNGE